MDGWPGNADSHEQRVLRAQVLGREVRTTVEVDSSQIGTAARTRRLQA
jgi:hypothetical protein